MSSKGAYLWGDTKYNPLFQKKEGWSRLALYAYQLEFIHPKTKKSMRFQQLPYEEPFDDLLEN